MKDWLLGKVSELGEKAVDSVVNIVLSHNDKNITDFKQTPLITAISRSVNAHIAIKQPNIVRTRNKDVAEASLGAVQVDILDSNFIAYPAQGGSATVPSTPASKYYSKPHTESQKGRIYFDGLGSIPVGSCMYNVSMTCNGRMAYSPLVEMLGDGCNRIRWNHQFIAELDDLWVDIGLAVNAEIDFNQFSQQHSKYSSPRMVNMVTRIPGVRCAQLSCSEATEIDPEEAQQLTSIYGKTKYKQRIGRAVISLPMLLDSSELKSTETLRENDMIIPSTPMLSEQPGSHGVATPGNDRSSTPTPSMGASTPVRRRAHNVTARASGSQGSLDCSHGQGDVTLVPPNSGRDINKSTSHMRRGTRMLAERGVTRVYSRTKGVTRNTLRDMTESPRASSVEAPYNHSKNNLSFGRHMSLDAVSQKSEIEAALTNTVIVSSVGIEHGRDEVHSFKSCSDDDAKESNKQLALEDTFMTKGQEQQNVVASEDLEKNNVPTNVNSDWSNASVAPSRQMTRGQDTPGSVASDLPMKIDTISHPELPIGDDLCELSLVKRGSMCSSDFSGAMSPVRRFNSGRDLSMHLLDDIDDIKQGQLGKDLQSLDVLKSEYRYYTEGVLTLQLLPFNEHKWDDEKFLRPIEGYPCFGMKSPPYIQGYIKVRVRVYLKDYPSRLALLCNWKHPRFFWQVPKELEFVHVSLICRRIEMFFKAKPRWIDKILLPKNTKENTYYITLFWLLLLDLMVFASPRRVLIDAYLLILLVSFFYKYSIGAMRYSGETEDASKPEKKAMTHVKERVETKNIGCVTPMSLGQSTVKQKIEDGGDKDASDHSGKGGEMSVKLEKQNSLTKEDLDNKAEATDDDYSKYTKGLTIWDFKGPEESMSKLTTPFGERELCVQRHSDSHRTATFVDNIGDTNYEELVRLIAVVMQLLQVILGYAIMLLEKLRNSLAFYDSYSWILVWNMLTVVFLVMYAVLYITSKVPLIVWRLLVYFCTLHYCLTFHSPHEGDMHEIGIHIRSLIWNQFKRTLWFFDNCLSRLPDSREIDHRSVSKQQIV